MTLPHRFQARIAAIFAITAHPEVPRSVDEIACPSDWGGQCYLDDTDVEHLVGSLRQALFGHSGRDSRALLPKFLRVAVEAGGQVHKAGTKAKDPSLLALELCQQAGLLWTRRKKSSLDGKTYRQLQTEAEDIVATVREWTPSEALRGPLCSLMLTDKIGPSLIEIERARRKGRDSEALVGKRALREGLLLRFPFLTPAEMDQVRKASHTVKQAARSLVVERQAADLSDKRLRNILSASGSRAS